MWGKGFEEAIFGAIMSAAVVALIIGVVLGASCTSCTGWWKTHKVQVVERKP